MQLEISLLKLDFQAAAQLHGCQQIEHRVTNIQYLLIRSPHLLLFSVNTERLPAPLSSFPLCLRSLLIRVSSLLLSPLFPASCSLCRSFLMFSPSSTLRHSEPLLFFVSSLGYLLPWRLLVLFTFLYFHSCSLISHFCSTLPFVVFTPRPHPPLPFCVLRSQLL